jgi:PadR family transcriptional regulator PadR
MDLQNWKTQLRKGLLDLCLLNLLSRGECYGYDLVQELRRSDVLHMREGTVYPVLARLEEDGLVRGEVRASEAGPPRKYYTITRVGKGALALMNEHWQSVEDAVRYARGQESEDRDE